MPTSDLSDIENVILDLDHTVWHWNRLMPGVKETIHALERRGKELYYLTNNSLLTRQGYVDKLSSFGIETSEDRIVSSPYVAASMFDRQDIRKVSVVGESAMVEEFEAQDINTAKKARNVVVGVDRNLTYWKIARAAEQIRNGSKLWSTALGSSFVAGDRRLPGTGAIVSAIREAAEVDDFEVVGKPSDHVCDVLKREFPIIPGKTMLIGDSITTDIVTGNKLGLDTGLVLGGTSAEKDLQQVSGLEVPDYVFRKFSNLTRKL